MTRVVLIFKDSLLNFQEIENKEHFDTGSLIVMIITLVLFMLALFFTGFTHALLLEVGVFLVSVRLIMMAYKTSVRTERIETELKEIKKLLTVHQDR
jgi:hypothetical protein